MSEAQAEGEHSCVQQPHSSTGTRRQGNRAQPTELQLASHGAHNAVFDAPDSPSSSQDRRQPVGPARVTLIRVFARGFRELVLKQADELAQLRVLCLEHDQVLGRLPG